MRAPPTANANNVDLSVEDTSFAQQLEAIIDVADLSATEKLILLKIRLRCDRYTLAGAYPSYATLARPASVKDARTVKRTADDLVDGGFRYLTPCTR